MFLKITLLQLFLIISTNAQNWDSPCPLQFNYDHLTNNSWSGIFKFKSNELLNGVRLDIILDTPPLDVKSDFGEVFYQKTSRFGVTEYSIVNSTVKIIPNTHYDVMVTVRYKPEEIIPYLRGFRVNYKTMCSSRGETSIDVKKKLNTIENKNESNEGGAMGMDENSLRSFFGSSKDDSWLSPCPKQFRYDSNKPGEWSGTITLTTKEELKGIWVLILLDLRPNDVKTNFGIIDYKNSSFENAAEYLIRKPNENLIPGETKEIEIIVKYNESSPPPLLVGYRLNAKPQCPENEIIDLETFVRPPGLTIPRNDEKNLEKGEVMIGDWPSPCPKRFRYLPESIKPGEWSGIINLLADEDLQGIWVRLTLDMQPTDVTTDFGIINYKKSPFPNAADYLIRKPYERLQEGGSLDIRITVKYDQNKPIPFLIGYRLNARPQCPENNIIDPSLFERPNIGIPPQMVSPALIERPESDTFEISTIDINNLGTSDITNHVTSPDITRVTSPDITNPGTSLDVTGHVSIHSKPPSIIITQPESSNLNVANLGVSIIDVTNPGIITGVKSEIPKSEISEVPIFVTRPGMSSENLPELESPCPDVFMYEPTDDSNKWFGVINWRPMKTLNQVSVSIILDKPAIQLGNWFSSVTTKDNIQYDLMKKNEVFPAQKLIKIRFFIKVDPNAFSMPELEAIYINGVSVCEKKQVKTIFTNDYIKILKYKEHTEIKISNKPHMNTFPIILI